MTTFLQGCQDLRQECRGAAGSGGPTTVVGQTGQLGLLVKWYKDAWTELQTKRDNWRWMRKGFTVNATVGLEYYAYTACTDVATSLAITRFAYWYRKSLKAYKSSDGVGNEYPLIYIEWESFRRLYHYGTQNNAQPIHVAIDPDDRLMLGPIPDATYVVSGDYQRSAQILAADTDVPEMPAEFHLLIQYEAMKKYGLLTPAAEVWTAGETQGKPIRRRLERKQLPPITWGNSLA